VGSDWLYRLQYFLLVCGQLLVGDTLEILEQLVLFESSDIVNNLYKDTERPIVALILEEVLLVL
jgi:hypothetical protein